MCAWSALGDFLEAKSEMPLAVTHGNLMALVLHSVDSTFGFDGWQSLSNPDVYLLHEDRAGQRSFERSAPIERFQIASGGQIASGVLCSHRRGV